MSRVDVFIPCYKYGHFLRGCVRSVLCQEGVDVHVLILDDASPDHTPEVAAQLLREDSRVSYRRHESNRGHIATYHEGLDWATGDYTLLLSADDLLTPGALARAGRLMDAHPEVGMTYGRAVAFQGDGPPPAIPPVPDDYPWRVQTGPEFLGAVCASGANPVATPTVVVRTRLQRQLGGYRAELHHSGDFEMWMRFAAHGSIGFVDAPQAFYRWHTSNMTHTYNVGTGFRNLEQMKAAFDVFFRDWGHLVPESERLRATIGRSTGELAFWTASRAFDRGDLATCRQYLDFALTAWPRLRSGGAWRRLRWKMLLGHRCWSLSQPILDRLRGVRPANLSGKA
ncbi:MAG TPA: glycosyltransferase [Gemmataceae bacterium]|jgi:glycosyltransferase involved in cell wall biosynthesis